MPANNAFFIILGKNGSLLQQHFLMMRMVNEMSAQATKKTANRLRLKPAFLMKLASKFVSLYGSGALI